MNENRTSLASTIKTKMFLGMMAMVSVMLVVLMVDRAFAEDLEIETTSQTQAQYKPNPYQIGVEAYRKGQYKTAVKQFEVVVRQQTDCLECHYYYAISLAQMGRVDKAREVYQQVIQMDPNSKAADLARTGLTYLPQGNELDVPPRLEQQAQGAAAGGQTANNAAGGMDPQTMQMMMLMSAMGGGKGGNNAMMLPMMMQMNSNTKPGEKPLMDPSMMQSLMMQNMMGDMGDLFSSGDK